MKVKLIDKEATPQGDIDFENEINEFIKDKKVVDIKFSGASNGEEMSWKIALIMYEDKE